MIDACMIPARSGSQRLAKKNYLPFKDSSILENTVAKALESGVFKRVVLNTDDEALCKVAEKWGVEIFIREPALASSTATSDQVVLDFLSKHDVTEVFWLNTVSPFTTVADIINFAEQFTLNKAKSAVSVNKKFVHATLDSAPVNFTIGAGFARTQDLIPITLYNYSIMAWSRDCLSALGDGVLFDKSTIEIETSIQSSILLKNEKDYELVQQLQGVW